MTKWLFNNITGFERQKAKMTKSKLFYKLFKCLAYILCFALFIYLMADIWIKFTTAMTTTGDFIFFIRTCYIWYINLGLVSLGKYNKIIS